MRVVADTTGNVVERIDYYSFVSNSGSQRSVQMTKKPRYSIKKYLLIGVISMTVGFISGAIILWILGSMIGFSSQTILVIILLSFPICLFSALYGFYKGLVRHYGFKGDEKLFFGGKF